MLLLALGCGEAGDTAEDFSEDLTRLEAGLEGYADWEQSAAWRGIQESNTSHDAYTEIWFNDIAWAQYAPQAGGEMPPGSLVAKQSYKDAQGEEKANFTAMMKLDDGEWLWAAWNPQGTLVRSGQPAFCVDCHAAGQDGVMVLTW